MKALVYKGVGEKAFEDHRYYRLGMYSHCIHGGWILGNIIAGTQAEYARIPFADTSPYHIPPGADAESVVMLSDILLTGFECGAAHLSAVSQCGQRGA